jgi:hypothetical protein
LCVLKTDFDIQLFKVVLKHKFKDVGVEKIERGDWTLQNHQTSHDLDVKKPWRAVVKAGLLHTFYFDKRDV